MHEDGAHFRRIGGRIEQRGLTARAVIGAKEGAAFGPSSASCEALPRVCVWIEGFRDEIRPVRDELRIHAEGGSQSALDLRGRVVAGLRVTPTTQTCCWGPGTEAAH